MRPMIPRRLRRNIAGFPEPEPTTSWRCRLSGCKVPSRINSSHPSNTVIRRYADGSTAGIAGPIKCTRCGRQVNPFDRDYPMLVA